MASIIKLKREHNNNDEELVAIFRSSGNLEILGELYSRYMHLVYGVSLKYLKNREEAMDAVMQIFEKLITDIPKQEIKNFSSWLHVVTRNYCLMQLRSAKSQKEKIIEWAADRMNFMENSFEMHPIDRDEQDMEEAINDCIKRLKKEQKYCIEQFYYENRCYREIAVNLGISEKNVKSYLQNGKRNLKLCLEEKNEKKR
jgi:RNA polymerase sigma-70 factor (ECF subfamily)